MIRGTITAMVTPFDAEGALDTEATRRVALWLTERGVDSVFVGGTTGEGLLLSLEERRRLAETTIEAVPVRVPSLADLIAMKEAAGRPKDLEDLKYLRALRARGSRS